MNNVNSEHEHLLYSPMEIYPFLIEEIHFLLFIEYIIIDVSSEIEIYPFLIEEIYFLLFVDYIIIDLSIEYQHFCFFKRRQLKFIYLLLCIIHIVHSKACYRRRKGAFSE